jgi:5-(carboxyamino)imidazole ribonucleotide mutase
VAGARVGIVMGSDSDLPVMAEAAKALEDLGVPVEVAIASAHRSPERATEYGRTARGRGLQVIIAGAGGAAHLAGVLAALTPLPVIAVPVKSASLDGLDSLLSMVQMPRGIPVATVGIDAAWNAGLLAARILAVGDAALMARLEEYAAGLARGVEERGGRLASLGYKQYLEQKKK